MLIFSASAEFFACVDFSAYPRSNFQRNVDCFKIQILKDLHKIQNQSSGCIL